MEPQIFHSLPGLFNFVAVALLIQISVVLFLTGKRFLKQVSIAASAVIGAIVMDGMGSALYIPLPWVFIVAGVAGGALLAFFLRPVAVGLVLAFIGYSISFSLVGLEYAQVTAALVLFTYGLLLTDLAPTFVSSLVAASILLLSGNWIGAPTPAVVLIASAAVAARMMATTLPSRLAARSQRNSLAS